MPADGIPEADAIQTLRWTSHPIREESPFKSFLLVAVLTGVTAAADQTFPGPIDALLSFVLLAGCMSRYFAPTSYEIGQVGLVVSHLGRSRTFQWEGVGRVVVFPDGVFLSPFAHPSRLDRFRGCFVRTLGNAAVVQAIIQRQTGKPPRRNG